MTKRKKQGVNRMPTEPRQIMHDRLKDGVYKNELTQAEYQMNLNLQQEGGLFMATEQYNDLIYDITKPSLWKRFKTNCVHYWDIMFGDRI